MEGLPGIGHSRPTAGSLDNCPQTRMVEGQRTPLQPQAISPQLPARIHLLKGPGLVQHPVSCRTPLGPKYVAQGPQEWTTQRTLPSMHLGPFRASTGATPTAPPTLPKPAPVLLPLPDGISLLLVRPPHPSTLASSTGSL